MEHTKHYSISSRFWMIRNVQLKRVEDHFYKTDILDSLYVMDLENRGRKRSGCSGVPDYQGFFHAFIHCAPINEEK